MPLRDELLAVDVDASLHAFMGQMDTDLMDLKNRETDEVADRYRQLLDEYPLLRYILEFVVLLNEKRPQDFAMVRHARVETAGLVLAAVKAAANNQAFGGLEVPPDLR